MIKSRKLEKIFLNPFYEQMRRNRRGEELFLEYLRNAEVNELVKEAGLVFEIIQEECNGVLIFNQVGKAFWSVQGKKRLKNDLIYSSNIEGEIFRRLTHNQPITQEVKVYGIKLSPEGLNEVFSQYYRNFNSSYSGKPARVESAFNHIPILNKPLEVRGFQYPHPVSETCW